VSERPRIDSGAENEEWEGLRPGELWHFLFAPLRRPAMVLVPWAAVFLACAAALWLLPKRYVSSALVLVESEKVPESFIARVATRDPSQRLEVVRPEILSRTRLERVADETDPYPGTSRMRTVEAMRERITIALSGNDGFTIAFSHHDPHKAQQVTDRLASLFIEETIKAREQQVEGAVDFLVTQLHEARRELESKDAALRRFKEDHMGRLPSQLDANLATMQMLQREAQALDESLLFARMKQESRARGGPSAEALELQELTRRLAELKGRYTDAHPDVGSLRARVARLQARLAEAGVAGAAARDDAAEASREQLARAEAEIATLERRRRDLDARMAAIRANIEETPRTEQELSTLTRDYDKLNENYTALLTKQLDAQMSGRLEHRWKREQFRILDPASLPEKPEFPKPHVFLLLGALVGLVTGIAAALVAESLDPTVKDGASLREIQGHALMATIPHLAALPAPQGLARIATPGLPAEGGRAPLTPLGGEAPRPGEPVFRHAGTADPRRPVPIIETLAQPASEVGEELRLFATRLAETCRRRAIRCVAVTSALPQEGKSTLCLGLAAALARSTGARVLLVDADLRRPSLSRMLGVAPGDGLTEWLNGVVDHVSVCEVAPGGFFLLGAGRSGLERPELMGSPRMAAALLAARRLFDYVILDSVPVLPVADTALLKEVVDGFQLVVRSRTTPREAIREALSRLPADRVIGVVFNAHREYWGARRYYGYKRYRAPAPGPADRLLVGLKGRR
jgi:polysaccharide chain length determinant protein (PEP-CTERM system associated)